MASEAIEAIDYATKMCHALGIQKGDENFTQLFEKYTSEYRVDKAAEKAAERDHIAKEAAAQRAHLEKMAQIQNAPANQSSSVAPARVTPSFSCFQPDLEQIDEFFDRFENYTQRYNIPAEEWVDRLMDATTPIEFQLIKTIPTDLRNDYKSVKATLFSAHAINSSKRKAEFKQCLPGPTDNGKMYLCKLQNKLGAWLSACNTEKTVKGLLNHFVLDQMFESLPTHLGSYIREQQAKTADEAANAIERYLEARPTATLHSLCKTVAKTTGPKNNIKGINSPDQQISAPKASNSENLKKVTLIRPLAANQTLGRNAAVNNNRQVQRTYLNEDRARTSPLAAQTIVPMIERTPTGCEVHGPNAKHVSKDCRSLMGNPPVAPNSATNNRLSPSLAPTPSSSSAQANVLLTEAVENVVLPSRAGEENDGCRENYQSLLQENAYTELYVEGEPDTVYCAYASTAPERGTLKTCRGILDGREVTVLLDSGADSIFIAK